MQKLSMYSLSYGINSTWYSKLFWKEALHRANSNVRPIKDNMQAYDPICSRRRAWVFSVSKSIHIISEWLRRSFMPLPNALVAAKDLAVSKGRFNGDKWPLCTSLKHLLTMSPKWKVCTVHQKLILYCRWTHHALPRLACSIGYKVAASVD